MKKTLAELADWLGGTAVGPSHLEITGITNIEEAGPGDITFAVPPHLEKAAKSQASAVVVPHSVDQYDKPVIRVDNPRVAFARLLALYHEGPKVKPGIHPTAVIGDNAVLGEEVTVMAYAVIGDHVTIGKKTVIYPHCYIGNDTRIGEECILYAGVNLYHQTVLGDRVTVHSGAVLGSDGFGFVTVNGSHHKVPQVGNVVVEDDGEIGANAAIDRATTGSTVIGRGTKIDNLVHVAHNVTVGEHCYLVAQTGIAGSAKIGNRVTFAGQSGSAGHLTIGDDCVFAARAAAIGDVPPKSFYAGFPARPHKDWLRAEGALYRVPDMLKKVRELEKRLAALEEK